VRFHLICLAGMVWGVVLLRAQVEGLGWNVYLANFLAIVLVSLWNFGLNLKFGWKGAASASHAAENVCDD
jgi:dolichol-phosphate mannosyltransferase